MRLTNVIKYVLKTAKPCSAKSLSCVCVFIFDKQKCITEKLWSISNVVLNVTFIFILLESVNY
jgi:hypothetical protein